METEIHEATGVISSSRVSKIKKMTETRSTGKGKTGAPDGYCVQSSGSCPICNLSAIVDGATNKLTLPEERC